MKTQLALLLLALFLAPFFNGLCATRTWDGEIDSEYLNPTNWVGDVVPANSDWTDLIVFSENAPSNKTPHLASNRKIRTCTFDNSAGWTFSGSQLLLRYLNSSGAGTNSFTSEVKTYQANLAWTVAAGNTLKLANLYIDGAYTITLQGGGTLVMSNPITGWSAARRLKVVSGTLRVEANAPFNSNGAAIIASTNSFVQLKASVAVAESRIGTFVLDEIGDGLEAIDLGDGYAQIQAINPPPRGTVITVI